MDAIYIAGATASGKSAIALELAERIDGEIISVDSMQVYRGLDIGTAKPNAEERARIRHHLIDVVDLTENFDVARFLSAAREAETEIRRRNRVPIYCGGTGLYFKALSSGIGHAPPSTVALREQLEATPLEMLVNELEEKDPETFSTVDRANSRRVIRAIEVIRTTGRPYSEQRARWERKPAGNWFGLERLRDDLHARIHARVDQMFAAGLANETAELLKRGLEQNRTAMQAIGYRQVVAHLRGERDLPATLELIKQKTRQFAKRQGTWFRNQLQLDWIQVGQGSSAKEGADEILRRVGEH
ncbi:MAG TPA: tRNA (adenosine(37)-N6)-dimethylallyltransferase MiaA [Verrucomicrobiae bacterium]